MKLNSTGARAMYDLLTRSVITVLIVLFEFASTGEAFASISRGPTLEERIDAAKYIIMARIDEINDVRTKGAWCANKFILKDVNYIRGKRSINYLIGYSGGLEGEMNMKYLITALPHDNNEAENWNVANQSECKQAISKIDYARISSIIPVIYLTWINSARDLQKVKVAIVPFSMMSRSLANGVVGWQNFNGDLIVCNRDAACSEEISRVKRNHFRGFKYFIDFVFIKKLYN